MKQRHHIDLPPGAHRAEQVELRDEEVVPDHDKVVDSARYDRIHHRDQANERDVDMNTSCRDPGPGGHSGKRDKSGDVEGDRRRQIDVDGIGYGGT
jgi:hypothetical protein